MSSLNKVMLIGNLGADPEVRYTQSNVAVANFSIATQNRYKDKNGEQVEQTEWHRVVAWSRQAEICQEYLKKGSKVYIEGELQTNEWEDKDGNKRYTTEVKSWKMLMLDTKDQGEQRQGQSTPRRQPSQQPSPQIDNSFDDMDDDLPF